MNSGVCCICYSSELRRLVRPIHRVRQSFWDHPETFTLNSVLKVRGHRDWFDLTKPHGNEDVLIFPHFVNLRYEHPYTIYCILWQLSQTSVSDIFGPQHSDWKFVPEGTNCRSVGVLRVQGKNVWLHYQTDVDRHRLQFRDANETFLNLPLTAVTYPDISLCHPEEYVLILIGLGRPYAGD